MGGEEPLEAAAVFLDMKCDIIFRRVLLIYQMPKTGSQTIEATLRQCRLPHRILRTHFLSPAVARRLKDAIRSAKVDDRWKQNARGQLALTAPLAKLLPVRRLLRACGAHIPKLEIITAIREPIGLTLSSTFENHARFVSSLEWLTLDICREAVRRPRMFNSIDDWFDTELKASTGLDVFAERFQPEKGYQVYENRFARVLLYRFEALPAVPGILSEFLGTPVPALVSRNLGSSKAYAAAYQFMKQHLRFPPEFVAERYSTRLMRHFYSESERGALHERWSERKGNATSAPAAPVSPGGLAFA